MGGMGGLGGMGGQSMEEMQQQMMRNPDMMRDMMNSPMMQVMPSSMLGWGDFISKKVTIKIIIVIVLQMLMDNPELMRQMMLSNPQLQAVVERNPELGHILNDPALLRQVSFYCSPLHFFGPSTL